ncbi:polyprenyl synthetase family protein [Vampirovibrio chlorellavorus]|uniref:polyprenyl synthetase family protein n=1 Tax=Vampirovibrio chlorellavorus TaxID=758823 RepID=UPI0026EFEA86|nr:farnesyl diphosphate synthase [Vampirovibrio chlorellavorus]
MNTQTSQPMTPPANQSYESLFSDSIERINQALERALDKRAYDRSSQANGLWDAMRYGTLDGGKRIRSVLALEACKACGGDVESILPTACAIEMVHAQSLIHDDLPCMDNDDMRRGKPSVHKAFGESTAVLAGDALIALAFGLIAKETRLNEKATPRQLLSVIGDFSDVTSVQGLVNGQFVDILYEGQPFTPEILEYIHTFKTGALFRFSLRAGARLAGADDTVVARFTQLGEKLGLAFQIVDDLLDIASSSETLGKTAGKDQLQQKATYPAFFGIEASRQQAAQLTQDALTLLEETAGMPPGYDSTNLKTLVAFIADRLH